MKFFAKTKTILLSWFQYSKLDKKYIKSSVGVGTRGLRSQMPFPGNQIFPEKIPEIPGPEHSRTSSSRSRLSTGIRDWLFPGLVKGWETFGNSRTLPEIKSKKIIFGARREFPDWYRLINEITEKISICLVHSCKTPFRPFFNF